MTDHVTDDLDDLLPSDSTIIHQYQLRERVQEVLQNAPRGGRIREGEPRPRRVFMASYPLAIAVAELLLQQGITLTQLGLPIGGLNSATTHGAYR